MKHRELRSSSWCPWWGLRFPGVSKGDRHCPTSLLYGSAQEQAVLNQCPQGKNWPNLSGSPSWTWLCEGAVSPGDGAGEPSTEASPLLPYSPPSGPRGITQSPHTWFCLKSRWRSPPILFPPPWVAPVPPAVVALPPAHGTRQTQPRQTGGTESKILYCTQYRT